MSTARESSQDEVKEGKVHRRRALGTMGRMAVGAAAAAVVGGVAYYAGTQSLPQAPQPPAKTVTQTVTAAQATVTQTATQAVTRTETVAPSPVTVTQTLTAPAAGAKLATDRETAIVAINLSGVISLDPGVVFEIVGAHPLVNIYNSLLHYKLPDLDASVPGVAESWTRSEDGLTWTFKIRDGIKFSNGDRLDAKAVEYSLKRTLTLKKPVTYWTNIIYLTDPNKVRALDSRTVQVTVNEKVAKSMAISAFSTFAYSVVNPNMTEPNAKEGDWGSAWLNEHSAGSGPYVLDSWVRDNQVVMKVNENYWGEPPKVKRIIMKHVPEPVTQALLLQKGDIDFAFGTGVTGLPVDIVEKLRTVEGVSVMSRLALPINYMGMNVGNPKDTPLKNVKVRNAIRWAIDYDGIVNGILKGGGEILQTLIPPGLIKFHLPSKPFSKNPARAKQLLAEGGYPNGFDIELAVSAGFHPEVDIASLLQSNLAEAGIRAKLVPLGSPELSTKYRAQGLQLVYSAWGGGFIDPENYGTGHACFDVKQIAWRNIYENEKQCQLAKAAAKEDDEAERARIYKELQEDMLKDTASAVTHVVKYYVGKRTWLEGWEMPLTWYFTDWKRTYKEKVVT